MTTRLNEEMEATRRVDRAARARLPDTDEITALTTELVASSGRWGSLLAWITLRRHRDPTFARIMAYSIAAAEPHLEQTGALMDVILDPEQNDPSTLLNTLAALDQRVSHSGFEPFLATGLASFLARNLASNVAVQDAAIDLLVQLLEMDGELFSGKQRSVLLNALDRMGERLATDPFVPDIVHLRKVLEGQTTGRWKTNSAELAALIAQLREVANSVEPTEVGVLLQEAVDALSVHLETVESAIAAVQIDRPVQSVRIARDRGRQIALSTIAAVSEAWRALFRSAAEAFDETAELFGIAAVPGSFVLRISVEDSSDAGRVLKRVAELLSEQEGGRLKEALSALSISATTYKELLEALCGDGVCFDVAQFDPERDCLGAAVSLTPASAEARLRTVRTYAAANLDSLDIPQADDLDRVFRLLRILESGQEVTPHRLDVVQRQVSYYRHAARVLDYLAADNALTSAGEQVAKMKESDQLAATAVRFEGSRVGAAWINWSGGKTLADIGAETATQFLKASVPNLSPSTATRRALTLRAWLTALLPHHYSALR